MALTLDRKAFIDILTEGQASIGGAMLPAPEAIWGRPSEILKTLPGYDLDVKENREQAWAIMRRLGYGPDKHLKVKVATRNRVPPHVGPPCSGEVGHHRWLVQKPKSRARNSRATINLSAARRHRPNAGAEHATVGAATPV